MSFYDLIQHAASDTLGTSLAAFLPELAICATIVVILLARIVPLGRGPHAFWLMLIGSLAALYFAAPWHYLQPKVSLPVPNGGEAGTPIFTGMLVYDKFAVYMRGLLLSFAVLFAVFTRLSGVPNRDDATDFYVLDPRGHAGHVPDGLGQPHADGLPRGRDGERPSYALAGMLRERRKSSEAALKFAVFGAATAGVMLYGISLLVGALGSAHLPTMARQLAELLQSGAGAERAWSWCWAA